MTRLILLLALFALCGCTTMAAYSGPRRPREQVAQIVPDRSSWGRAVCVDAVDGFASDRYYLSFEVLPGPHEIRLSVSERSAVPIYLPPFCGYSGCVARYDHYGPAVVKIAAQAGRTYDVAMRRLDDGSWSLWIQDEAKRVVGAAQTGPTPRDTSWEICETKK
ncbi:MAG TPA: hypothetical protein VKH64_06590 [Candidatus Binatia bacterium]|nr:hypothetical protein [Candidatus Binatia bacterium]